MPQQRARGSNNLWDKTWQDRHGQVVIWQTPNRWLVAWALLTVMSLWTTHRTADLFSGLASLSLITWSLLEIRGGVNYFRCLLGLLVLPLAIMTLIRSF